MTDRPYEPTGTSRRAFLTTGVLATAAVAGCLGNGEAASPGTDDEPLDADPDDLILAPVHFEEVGWTLEVESSDGPNHLLRRFRNLDDRLVRAQVWTFETVDAAESDFEDRYEEASDQMGFTADDEVGVEQFATASLGRPKVVFRDANAIGSIWLQTGEIEESLEFAVMMHSSWRD